MKYFCLRFSRNIETTNELKKTKGVKLFDTNMYF